MDPLIEDLIIALREELKEYGEMLALLDMEQEQVVAHEAEGLFQCVNSIQAQSSTIQAARRNRHQCINTLATHFQLPDTITIAELISRVPAEYRPLLAALIEENNQLLVRVDQRARQNHLLLSRSLELLQQFVGSLFANRETPIYNGKGTVPGSMLPNQSLYEAVG